MPLFLQVDVVTSLQNNPHSMTSFSPSQKSCCWDRAPEHHSTTPRHTAERVGRFRLRPCVLATLAEGGHFFCVLFYRVTFSWYLGTPLIFASRCRLQVGSKRWQTAPRRGPPRNDTFRSKKNKRGPARKQTPTLKFECIFDPLRRRRDRLRPVPSPHPSSDNDTQTRRFLG